jgi:hypothetical protein
MQNRGKSWLSWTFLVVVLSAFATGCPGGNEGEVGGGKISGAPIQEAAPHLTERTLTPPSIHLRIYPDMAVPGKEVVVEAELVPHMVSESPTYSFKTLTDPCEGSLEQEGQRAVYQVPSDCRGSGITIEITVDGSFGRLVKTVDLDIKKTSFMDSVVFTYPVPGQRAQSPISVWWDRTLYHNRKEKLSFRVKRFGEFILETGFLEAGQVIELDIPPSPEEIVLFGETTTGSQETALIRVHSRQVPEWPGNVLLLDRFTLPDTSSLEAPRVPIKDGGKCDIGTAWRISSEGREPYLYMHYHVSKAKRYGVQEALIGFREEVPIRATRTEYKELEIWLRGDPVRGGASPVYVRLEGSSGSKRTFKIKRIRDNWRPYHFPLDRALRRSNNERLSAVSVFVDAKDVTPPLGTILFGGLYLKPHRKKKVE